MVKWSSFSEIFFLFFTCHCQNSEFCTHSSICSNSKNFGTEFFYIINCFTAAIFLVEKFWGNVSFFMGNLTFLFTFLGKPFLQRILSQHDFLGLYLSLILVLQFKHCPHF